MTAFSLSLGPTYPWLRSIATSPQWGTNFAVAGATAVNWTDYWYPNTVLQTPYSLNYQLQWLRRYKVRLDLYYQQTCKSIDTTQFFCNDPSIYKDFFSFLGGTPTHLSLSSLVLVCIIEALELRFVSMTRCYTGAACLLHTQHLYVRCASWIPGLLLSAILWDSNRKQVDRPS